MGLLSDALTESLDEAKSSSKAQPGCSKCGDSVKVDADGKCPDCGGKAEVAEDYEDGIVIETSQEQWEEGAELIEKGADLVKMIQDRVKRVGDEFSGAQKRMARMKQIGVGKTESPALLLPVVRELRSLAKFISGAADHAVKVTGLHEHELPIDDDTIAEELAEAKFGAGGAGGYAVEIVLGLQKLDHSIKGDGTGFKKGSVEGDVKVTEVGDGSFRVEVKTHGRRPTSLMFTTKASVKKVATSSLPKEILAKLDEKDAFAEEVEDLDEGASPGARSKGTGFGRGETSAAGEFWDKGPEKGDKKAFNKAQRSGKKKHIDAQMKGEGLSGELEDALVEGAMGEDEKALLRALMKRATGGKVSKHDIADVSKALDPRGTAMMALVKGRFVSYDANKKRGHAFTVAGSDDDLVTGGVIITKKGLGALEEAKERGIKSADGISVGDTVIVVPRKDADSMTKGPLKDLIGEVDFIQAQERDGGGHLAWVKFRGNSRSSEAHVNTKDLKQYKSGAVEFAKVK